MAVKDFIPVNDSKLTTEKLVRVKPSLSDLTTIESPGRPTPADSLESPTKRKRRRKKKDKAHSSSVKVTQPKRDSILIITEKPQAAEKISSALSGNTANRYTESGVSFYEFSKNNERIIVASAVGHLFNLTYTKGQTGWPIFKTEWQPSYETKSGSFTRKYYSLLKKLSRRAKEVVIATDFDIEGEVIGWNVLRFICEKSTAKRMKYSTLTTQELIDSYDSLLSEPHWGNAYAGETRHILDWLYGINLSRALMSAIKKTGSFKILSIGRVQGPALKVIVDREREIQNFKSEPFWRVIALSNGLEFRHPKDIFSEPDLEQFKNLSECLASTEKRNQSIEPPHPFDLTTLQREAYRLHKIAPSTVLKAAQKLYLNGLISYPRTSSQKIPESVKPKQNSKETIKEIP